MEVASAISNLRQKPDPDAIRARVAESYGDDFAADMAKMAADPKTQEWWDVMMPMQVPLETRAEGEWWAEMEEVFHTD